MLFAKEEIYYPMKRQSLGLALYAIMVYLTYPALNPAIADLNVGEPRTVRLIYFLPNDRPYRANVVQRMKDEILNIQTFYAEQMRAHGYGFTTFRVETDSQGEPIVHRVDGQHPDSHYLKDTPATVYSELKEVFDFSANIYVVVIDNSIDAINLGGSRAGGIGHRNGKSGGQILVSDEFAWKVAAHELGHALGLHHDFSNGAYIMSYGRVQDRLSSCHAEFLVVHPYLNPNTPIEEGQPPTIELISPRTDPTNSQSVPVRLKVRDSEGLHQVLLTSRNMRACRGLGGEKDTVVEFNYNDVIPPDGVKSLSNPAALKIVINAVDTGGNVSKEVFVLDVTGWTPPETLGVLSKISGDNQHGVPNAPLSNPFIVEVRNLKSGVARSGVSITFAITAGGGTLSTTRTMTDENGRAQSTLTLGPNVGTNAVKVSAPGIEEPEIFIAVAKAAAHIPDAALRTAFETVLKVEPGNPIAPVEIETLTVLDASETQIRDLTGLELATNLIRLDVSGNGISDISPVAGLDNLSALFLDDNSISDISPVAGLTNLIQLDLSGNNISDISMLMGLTKLRKLWLEGNAISDITALVGLINLETLFLGDNSISDISPVVGLTNLTWLNLKDNNISDISPVAELANLLALFLGDNSISDISPVVGLTKLWRLGLEDNMISDITPLVGLTRLSRLWLQNNSISDLSPLIENTGLGAGDQINVSENPLNHASIHLYIRVLQIRGGTVKMDNLKPTTLEYSLLIPAGISLIHLPLKVTTVDDVAQTIERISDLYDALGGTSKVNFLITYDSQTQEWYSYFGPSDKGSPADRLLTDEMGIIVGLRAPVSVYLRGTALGTNASSTITLNQGLNIVGLPLNDSRIMRVSDLFALDGIGDNVPAIILTDGGEFKLVGRAGDPGDIEITGGQAFIMTASRAATVTISGDAWANDSGTAAAPPVTRKGIEVGNTTPVLGLRGSILDEGTGLNNASFRVTVKNLSTGRAVATVTTPDEAGYRSTVVDIEAGRAAMVGDILEISAQSPNPSIGVEPLLYTVTAEDVKQSLIQLPELVAYEIPAETQLLSNYPNPFNPETWIPYRLAEDAFVTLTIYDLNGQAVRTIDVGHQTAAVYENRSKAVYWDGRNGLGGQVASGVYFYHLSAGDYSATRKMLILK